MLVRVFTLTTIYDNDIFIKSHQRSIEVAFYEHTLYIDKKPFIDVDNQHLNNRGILKLLHYNKENLQDFLKINEISEIEYVFQKKV